MMTDSEALMPKSVLRTGAAIPTNPGSTCPWVSLMPILRMPVNSA